MSDIITLNVGGIKYTTTKNTLTNSESMLSAMFTTNFVTVEPQPDGSYFIDRNGENFKYILKYLRDSKINIENMQNHQVQDIIDEAKYYGITKLVGSIVYKYSYNEEGKHYYVIKR